MGHNEESSTPGRGLYVHTERVHCEPTPRWVRVMLAGQVLADSKRAMLLLEAGYLPVYYFPQADVQMHLLIPIDQRTHCPCKGDASYWSVEVGDRVVKNAAWSYLQPLEAVYSIKGHLAFDWDKMDAWFEEDEEVYVHARDPYRRVDALRSSRQVKVVIAGETVAESKRPCLLFETGLPTRYYIPKVDVRMDLLTPSDTTSRCPYKGQARYYSAKIGDKLVKDIAWYYPYPVPECPRIENLVCFYNERVDELYVDGKQQEKPQTPWS